MSAFYDYVRGLTDEVPEGYTQQGMAVYRYHVYLGVSQMLAGCYPQLKDMLEEADWRALMEDFIRQTRWSSHFYADLTDEFEAYLRTHAAQEGRGPDRETAGTCQVIHELRH